jgi:hypothetical protein
MLRDPMKTGFRRCERVARPALGAFAALALALGAAAPAWPAPAKSGKSAHGAAVGKKPTRPLPPSSAPAAAPPKHRKEFPAPDTSRPPPSLPPAPRAKMRECAEAWAKLKMETRGTPPLWRDFAGQCLTR